MGNPAHDPRNHKYYTVGPISHHTQPDLGGKLESIF